MKKTDIIKQEYGQLYATAPEYVRLVSLISNLWEDAKAKAAIAVNTELLDANDEHDLENAIARDITRFLLGLGNGFTYVGRQSELEVGADDYQ